MKPKFQQRRPVKSIKQKTKQKNIIKDLSKREVDRISAFMIGGFLGQALWELTQTTKERKKEENETNTNDNDTNT